MNKILIYTVIIIHLLFFINLKAQDNSEKRNINYGALTQFHFSYANSDSVENPYGFRVRRIDFKVWQAPTKIIDWSLLLGFGDFKFQILEVFLNFHINDPLNIRVGQFAPPAVRSAAPVDDLFKVPTMSFIERPPITLNWSIFSNLYAYRTFGIQLHGKIFQNKLYYAIMVGNPNGGSFFNASSRNVYHEKFDNGLSYWGRLEYEIEKRFVVGGFFNTSESIVDLLTHQRYSFGGHLLYKRNDVSFMAEFIQGENTTSITKAQRYRGGFIEFAYRIDQMEPAVRYDFYQPIVNSYDNYDVKIYHNFTIGMNLYPIEKIKIQVNYIFKAENMVDNHTAINNDLFYTNLQFLL